MNLKATVYILAAALLLIFRPSLGTAEAGWTDYAYLAELVPTARHYYELRLPAKNNPSGCRNSTWFYQDYGLRASDRMFTTLLEALQAGKRVRVYVTGKCNLNGYSEFTAVGIIP
jgi:hypothetical protein